MYNATALESVEIPRRTREHPIRVAGGVNLYQYVGNNPASYTDPFGLCPPIESCLAFANDAALSLMGANGGRFRERVGATRRLALGTGLVVFEGSTVDFRLSDDRSGALVSTSGPAIVELGNAPDLVVDDAAVNLGNGDFRIQGHALGGFVRVDISGNLAERKASQELCILGFCLPPSDESPALKRHLEEAGLD